MLGKKSNPLAAAAPNPEIAVNWFNLDTNSNWTVCKGAEVRTVDGSVISSSCELLAVALSCGGPALPAMQIDQPDANGSL